MEIAMIDGWQTYSMRVEEIEAEAVPTSSGEPCIQINAHDGAGGNAVQLMIDLMQLADMLSDLADHLRIEGRLLDTAACHPGDHVVDLIAQTEETQD